MTEHGAGQELAHIYRACPEHEHIDCLLAVARHAVANAVRLGLVPTAASPCAYCGRDTANGLFIGLNGKRACGPCYDIYERGWNEHRESSPPPHADPSEEDLPPTRLESVEHAIAWLHEDNRSIRTWLSQHASKLLIHEGAFKDLANRVTALGEESGE